MANNIRVGIKGTDIAQYFNAPELVYTAELMTALGFESLEDTTALAGKTLEPFGRNSRQRVRISVKYDDGTKLKSARVFCAKDKIDDVQGGSLNGLKYKNKNIIAAYVPNKLAYA